jgi:uncharacterized protein YfiM (DUF2279 family)
MKWVNESEAQHFFMTWLFGSAGAAIAKKKTHFSFPEHQNITEAEQQRSSHSNATN